MATRKELPSDPHGKKYLAGAQKGRCQRQDSDGLWVKYDSEGRWIAKKKTPGPWKGVRRAK